MERRQLFLETLDDIQRRARGPVTEYDVLMMAVPLRKLLIDGDPLVHQVNREHRKRLRFTFNEHGPPAPPLPQPVLWSMQDGLDPDTAPPFRRPREGKLDDLLGQVVLVVRGEAFSVRDVIAHVAHVAGAVHAGQPKNPREELLASVSQRLQIGGLDPVTRSLQAIGRVVIKGVGELRTSVEAELGIGGTR